MSLIAFANRTSSPAEESPRPRTSAELLAAVRTSVPANPGGVPARLDASARSPTYQDLLRAQSMSAAAREAYRKQSTGQRVDADG